jgi:aryl-alcohol dehydrogenase-like predicted oxidoreductase
MEQRTLGRTGLRVSALGFGTGAIGGLFVRGDRGEQREAIARALEAGITYFDTAPSYGEGRSEENLGRVLRELQAWRHTVVGTKVRLQAADLHDPRTAIVQSVQGSLKRLGRPTVDLLQLHNPIIRDGAAGPPATAGSSSLGLGAALGGVAEGMQAVLQQGLAAHVGITGLGDAGVLREVIGSARYETIQTYFNALNPSAGFPGATGGAQDFAGVIDAAADAAMGAIAIRVMAAGALSATPRRHARAGDPGAPLVQGAEYSHDLERARRLEAIAVDSGVEGPLELALRFALAKRGVSVVLVGYSDLAQLEDAIRWAGRGPLSEHAVTSIVELARLSASSPASMPHEGRAP